MGVKCINNYFTTSCLIGLALSIYSYFVELNIENDEDYVAVCDISEHMSCTKAFSSSFGKGFGLVAPVLGEHSILNQPNSLSGIIFYSLLLLIGLSERRILAKMQVGLSIASNVLSVYLAFILYFVLHDFCIVCVSLYVINAVNLCLSIVKWRRLTKKKV